MPKNGPTNMPEDSNAETPAAPNVDKVRALADVLEELVDKLNDPAEAIEFDFPEVAQEISEAGWQATRRAMEILYDTRWDEARRRFIPPLPIEEELQDD